MARGDKSNYTDKQKRQAEHIEDGLEEIRHFYREHDRQDLLEASGELQSLEMWLHDIQTKWPLTPREKLESALNEAVRNENYEEAARVRDALRKMG